MAWSPLALPAIATFAVSATLAALIVGSGAPRRQHVLLALLIAGEGVADFAAAGVPFLVADPGARYDLARWLWMTIYVVFPVGYLLFLATLDSPLSRPLRSRTAGASMLAYALVGLGVVALRPDWLLLAAGTPEAVPVFGPLYPLASLAFMAVLLFGLAVSVSTYRRAPAGDARTRARLYAIAFGVRDVAYVLTLAIAGLLAALGRPSSDPLWFVIPFGMLATAVAFDVLVTYGILRSRVLDIDLRIKAGLHRLTVVGAFVVAFFVVEEIAQAWLDARLGVLAGAIAAALLLFALRPLERAAERLVARALPHTGDPEAHLARRRVAVYRAAVESALEEGGISDRERRLLDRLAAKLHVRPEEAAAIEADVAARA